MCVQESHTDLTWVRHQQLVTPSGPWTHETSLSRCHHYLCRHSTAVLPQLNSLLTTLDQNKKRDSSTFNDGFPCIALWGILALTEQVFQH